MNVDQIMQTEPAAIVEKSGEGTTGLYLESSVRRMLNKAFDDAAEIAKLAPGQDWTDGTTPGEMAVFIAEVIEGRKSKIPDAG